MQSCGYAEASNERENVTVVIRDGCAKETASKAFRRVCRYEADRSFIGVSNSAVAPLRACNKPQVALVRDQIAIEVAVFGACACSEKRKPIQARRGYSGLCLCDPKNDCRRSATVARSLLTRIKSFGNNAMRIS